MVFTQGRGCRRWRIFRLVTSNASVAFPLLPARDRLRCLAAGVGLGRISRSSTSFSSVEIGDVKTFRWLIEPSCMQQDSQIADRVAEFQLSVSRHFQFLTTTHGFTRHDLVVRDVESPKDASVSITFHRADLRITIGLGLLLDTGLGITIRDNNWLDKPAPPMGTRRVKTVYFKYRVEFMTDGESQPIVPHYGDGPTRRFNAARTLIADSLDLVVEQLAAKMRSFSPQILDGDVTSVFNEADEYYNQKLRG
jgi:hypothetical protein